MNIRITGSTVVDSVVVSPGDVLSVADDVAAFFIKLGKAEPVLNEAVGGGGGVDEAAAQAQAPAPKRGRPAGGKAV